MSTRNPSLTVNNAQNVQKERCTQTILFELVSLIGFLLWFSLKLVYYWIESIYQKFKPPTPVSVKGEIVLITGTGHGIGKELALVYSANGATVVGLDINQKNNDQTIKEIAEFEGRPQAYSFQCDITNREEVLKTANLIQSSIGDVNILINNAGIMPCHPLTQHTPLEIEKIISLNLTSHFWLLEAFLPAMKKINRGHIVSISSMAGLMGIPYLVPYCASKYAVRGYMEALHEELRLINPNNQIKTTCIYPYMVDTGLCKKPKIRYENLMPLRSPKEVASKIMEEQTKGTLEATIPSYLSKTLTFGRLIPYNAAMYLKDHLEAIVESDSS